MRTVTTETEIRPIDHGAQWRPTRSGGITLPITKHRANEAMIGATARLSRTARANRGLAFQAA